MFRFLMNIKKLLYLLFLCTISIVVQAQTANQFVKAAEESIEDGEYNEAIAYYSQALKFNKNESAINYEIGKAYYQLKDYESAAASFDKVKDLSNIESFVFLEYYKGITNKLMGDYDESIKHFKKFVGDYRENDFYKLKAQQELASCSWALDHLELKNAEISHLSKPINTGYSEFAANYIEEDLLLLSALVPENKSVKKSPFVSQLKLFRLIENSWKVESFNHPEMEDKELANVFYLPEKNRVYYSICERISADEKRCDLAVSDYTNNVIGEATFLNINIDSITTTQPSVHINEKGKDVLHFTSDREGGIGKLDIWMAEELEYGVFNTPNNLGPLINTIDNESTPFYHATSDALYFSSEWHYGFGGYDIFKAKNTDYGWSSPINMGQPLNAAANDQYFYFQNNDEALFASNRQGAMQLRGSACCYDVFSYKSLFEDIPEEDTSLLVIDEPIIEEPPKTPIILLQELLPAEVYFHNDEPNPKTTYTSTFLSYDDCYDDYLVVRKDYYENFPNESALNNFFDNKLDQGYDDLKALASILEEAIKEDKLTIELKGYCSPLAESDYNIKLAERRISSLKNFFKEWNNGVFKSDIDNGRIEFTQAPFGESKAPISVSDDYYNTRESIYNPLAAQERKVSIIAITKQE